VPSPFAHTVALAVVSWALPGRSPLTRRERLWLALALAVAAIAPDFDFIPGILIGDYNRFHHGATHSLTAAGFAGLATWAVARAAGLSWARRLAVLVTLAYLSHLALDMATYDGAAPYGVPLLWPASGSRFTWPVHLFMDIRREKDEANFFVSLLMHHNLRALMREVIVIAGAFVVASIVRVATTTARRIRTSGGPSGPPLVRT
jgi:membrane-bound metal-dependent hydrolase YbcI (DUF457 family)